VIVGSFTNGTGTHGFVDNAGTFTTLDYPGALNTLAVGINGSGDVVGQYNNSSGGGSFLLSGGQYSTVTVPGATGVTSVEGINDAGQIVGLYDAGSHSEGFIDAAGTVSTISVPNSISTIPTAINATGTIVGYYTDSVGHGRGFLDVGGAITTFDPPGAVATFPFGISDSGTIYGSFGAASGIKDGFIGTPGTFTEFDLPGALVTGITGIGSGGDLAGNVEFPSRPGSTTPGPSQALFVQPNVVRWSAGSGNFNTASDWTPQVVPGATNDAIIDAAGTYTVTVSTNETVNTLVMAANARLVVSAGTFTASNGSGVGPLAGSIIVQAGAVLALAGSAVNTGTIAGAGQFGAGALAFTNGGTVNANAAVGLTIDLGGHAGQNLAGGLIEATGAGELAIAGGTVSNAGTMLAANGSALTFQSAAVNSNNTGGILGGSTWEASGNGSTLAVTGGAVTQDKATIILSGTGSVFSAGDDSTFTNLEASLLGVAPIGTLQLLAGRSFTATHGVADFGAIQLGGGTLTEPRLAVGASGHVRGFGTIADTRYPIYNLGTIEANGGTLAIATAIDPASGGVFQLDASSFLEIAEDQGAGDTMSFLGAGGELIIDDVQKFGLNVGASAYTGPLVENFVSGDMALLKNLAPAGLVPVYNPATGILQISNGSANVASLAFDNGSLGGGAFHIGDDGHGHAMLTRS
jgi:hypothetical protein